MDVNTAPRRPGDGEPIPSVRILGVRVDDVTIPESVSIIESFIRSGKKHQVVTTNPEFVMAARKNREFRAALNASSLSIPDGIGVVYASGIFGRKIRERATGADLVERLAELAAGRDFTLYFLGAGPGVAGKAAAILAGRYPGLKVVGTYGGSPSPEDEPEITGRINAVRPDILCVAYGSPRQDLWIARVLPRLDVSVAIGVGGTFDFIAGVSKRAPEWVRASGFEWLHRLIGEPWRWKRMLNLPKFALLCLGRALSPPSLRDRSPDG